METSIVTQSKNILDEHVAKDQSQLELYLKISELNKSLVDSGLSKSRGYNLLTTEEIYSQSLTANFSQTFAIVDKKV